MAMMGTRVDEGLAKDVEAHAKKLNMKVSAYIAEALREKVTRGTVTDKRQLPLLKQLPKGTENRREMIFKMLTGKPAAKFELAARLGWEEHWVSPRLTELKKMGLIEADGRKVNPASGDSCAVWKTTTDHYTEGGF